MVGVLQTKPRHHATMLAFSLPLQCSHPARPTSFSTRLCRPRTALPLKRMTNKNAQRSSFHMCAGEKSGVSDNKIGAEARQNDSSFAPYAREEEEELFVLEDDHHHVHDYMPSENEEDQPAAWTQLPKPRAVIRTSIITDVVIFSVIVAIVYGLVVTTGSLFSAVPYSSLHIDTSLSVLPWYAAQSLTRMTAGYLVSLIFSLSYAYLAYRVKFAATLLILAIDVLQSIPLLSFLPGVVLGLIAIFPGARIGVELAAVLLLFTSMAWNMLLGFYQSLCCIPHDLLDAAHTFRLSPWKRFWTLELPAGAIGLIWNSVISVAGGWFFLISIESFELGNRDFKLPGLGSFLAVAAENSNYSGILCGLLVVIGIIVAIDFFIWRPLITWSSKFTMGGQQLSADRKPKSAVLNALQRSPLVRTIHSSFIGPAWEDFVNLAYRNPFTGRGMFSSKKASGVSKMSSGNGAAAIAQQGRTQGISAGLGEIVNVVRMIVTKVGLVLPIVVKIGAIPFLGYCGWQATGMVGKLGTDTWIMLATSAAATFGRVIAALSLSLLWTVPAGVAIGRNAKLSARLQPIVQIAASVPATALFPFVLLFIARLGGGLEIGSIGLMMLGTMWYVLFNVIAGAQAIPAEFFDVDSVYNKKGWFTRWKSLILPGIFPYLITGIVTAVGGAWNASIVSEYVVFQGGVLKTHGLGAVISEAAASGNYAVLLAGTVIMSVLVLLTNKFVWSPMYRLAETKYRI